MSEQEKIDAAFTSDPDGKPDGEFRNEKRWKESDTRYEKELKAHDNMTMMRRVHKAWRQPSLRDELRMGVNYDAS